MNDDQRYKALWFALGYGMGWQRWAYLQGYESQPTSDWLPI